MRAIKGRQPVLFSGSATLYFHAQRENGANGRTERPPVSGVVSEGTPCYPPNTHLMNAPVRDMPELELAMLRRGVDELAAVCVRCQQCGRTPLIGERIYTYAGGAALCELCRVLRRDAPMQSNVVHGPEFGHTLRISDRRATGVREVPE